MPIPPIPEYPSFIEELGQALADGETLTRWVAAAGGRDAGDGLEAVQGASCPRRLFPAPAATQIARPNVGPRSHQWVQTLPEPRCRPLELKSHNQKGKPMNLTRATHPTRLRVIVVAAVLAVAGLFASASQAASARTTGAHAFQWRDGPKPVIVLEHGAWADASSWSEVIQRLQGDGFTVYAPPNPLRGLPQDSAYLHDFLTQNAALAGQPVVLVGHSMAGRSSPTPPSATPR